MAIIDKPSDYFEAFAYTGDGNTKVNFASDFTPNMTWFKVRNNTYDHQIHDSVRGVNAGYLDSATTVVEQSSYPIASFDSDGVTTVSGNITGVNKTSDLMCSWNWKETADAGFDIVAYTGNGSNRTISHNLGAVPKMMIVKERDNANDWKVYHHSIGNGKSLRLDTTTAQADDSTAWNSTTPTSSVFSVGTSNAVNRNGGGIIAYLFAEKQGYSKFSSYVGSGNADGPMIVTGMKPAYVMLKRTDTAGERWNIKDNKRDGYNQTDPVLTADAGGAEYNDSQMDLLSNGFKIRTSAVSTNASGGTYIYMAFAENPFVTSTGVPATAR